MQGKFLSDCWVGRQSTLAGSRNVFSQISGRRQTFEELKQSDVWGFCAVLFFMVSKTVPWSEHTLSREIVAALISMAGKMTCPRVAGCPEKLLDLCEACCDSDSS